MPDILIKELRNELAAAREEIERLKVESRDACFGLNDYYQLQLASRDLVIQQMQLLLNMDGWLKDRHLGGLMPDELKLIQDIQDAHK